MITKFTKKINKFFNKDIRALIFFVTAKCPLRCSHCFYGKEINQQMDELTLEEIEKIADKLPNLETLQLSGGEPFLRTDLIELIQIFVSRGVKSVGIPTNGFYTNKTIEQCKKMKELGIPFKINLSLDSFKDIHDKIRGVEGTFDKAIKTYRELRKLDIQVGFNVAISKINYDTTHKFLDFLEKENPDYINNIIVRAMPEVQISLEQFIKLRPRLEEMDKKYKTPFYAKRQSLYYDIAERAFKGKRPPFKCQAGKIIAVLEPDGQVRRCEMQGKIANVRDYSYDLKTVLKMDKTLQKSKGCEGCFHPCFVGVSIPYSVPWLIKLYLS